MMKRSFGVLVLVAIAIMAFISSACSLEKGLTEPSPNPIPDQSKYEAVPTEKKFLSAHMWARLVAEPTPPRGSQITVGPSACPNGCFQNLQLEIGFDTVPNPYVNAGFKIGFSQDGIAIAQLLTSLFVRNGNLGRTDPARISVFPDKPIFLVIQGSFLGDTNSQYGTFPGEEGTTKFLLDYK